MDVAGGVYVTADQDHYHPLLFHVWIYQEANGERGLQRGGVTMLGDADICQDSPTPDQGVF